MGLDPGFATTGYALIDGGASRFDAVTFGAVRTTPEGGHAARLADLFARLDELIATHRPEAMAVERLFFNSNVRTAIGVGQASGVALVVAARAGLEVFEYTPGEVKQAVAGVGSAPKSQVQSMVASLLNLATVPSPPDAADACALAICHINSAPLRAAVARSAR